MLLKSQHYPNCPTEIQTLSSEIKAIAFVPHKKSVGHLLDLREPGISSCPGHLSLLWVLFQQSPTIKKHHNETTKLA